jgi:hypothetical protein
MGDHAVAIRRDDASLALFLRIVRSPSGIYVVFAAGQARPRHDPHSSWHRDGRVHHKSFGREFTRGYKQPLTGFAGADHFVTTSTSRDAAPNLPDCAPARFNDVIEVRIALLRPAPQGTQIDVSPFAAGAGPVAPAVPHRIVSQSVIVDGDPRIAVTIYDVL